MFVYEALCCIYETLWAGRGDPKILFLKKIHTQIHMRPTFDPQDTPQIIPIPPIS